MAVKFDLAVFLESVGAGRYTRDLLHHGVDTLDKLAILTQDRLTNWNLRSGYYAVLPAIRKAERLMKSSNSVVQEELLVRDRNFNFNVNGKVDCCLLICVDTVKAGC